MWKFFGVSAHSFDGVARRWSNERDTNEYVRAVEAGKEPKATDESLTGKQLAAEFAFLNLRLSSGLNRRAYHARFGTDVVKQYREDLDKLTELGFIAISDESIVLTKKGMLFSNEVFEVFV